MLDFRGSIPRPPIQGFQCQIKIFSSDSRTKNAKIPSGDWHPGYDGVKINFYSQLTAGPPENHLFEQVKLRRFLQKKINMRLAGFFWGIHPGRLKLEPQNIILLHKK